MSKFNKIIEQCIIGKQKVRKWRYAVSNYNVAIKILQQKQTYSNDDQR